MNPSIQREARIGDYAPYSTRATARAGKGTNLRYVFEDKA